MKCKLFKTLVFGLLLNAGTASAAIINFNGGAESDFTIDELVTKNFIVTGISDGLGYLAPDRIGTDVSNPIFRGKNYSLLTWTNSGFESGFTLATDNGDLFSLESFQSGNGYLDDSFAVSSLTLNGLLSDGSSISESFSSLGKINLSTMWDNLVSVEFIAYGENNRAYWDSIRYERFAAPVVSVPEPSTLLIFTLSLLAITSRKFAAKR
ncbi:MAG: PEP-CTERM sorting domain-containing protein [Aliiglaciecola sp.]|uniref:PEP-CTERM sorting domain-containing protein n=1 Tax=Aliiglaciecola sp. TaxID=1872441 RepID=UPI003296AE04